MGFVIVPLLESNFTSFHRETDTDLFRSQLSFRSKGNMSGRDTNKGKTCNAARNKLAERGNSNEGNGKSR